MNNDKSKKSTGLFTRLFLFLLAFTLLTGCNFPNNTNISENNEGHQPDDFATPSTNIQFILHIPEPIQNEEKIIIEILDEVSGLPFNIRSYELEQMSDLEYALQLSFPTGSVLKYRYARLAGSKIPEINSSGNPVRYRLGHVTHSIQLIDQLWGWQGDSPNQLTGTLSGTIQNQENSEPLPDMLVSAGGRMTFSDANGSYLLDELPSGVHNLVIYALDGSYQTFQQGAQISPGAITTANIELQSSPIIAVRFNVTPPEEAQGAPIYLAGNLIQLGNTFSEQTGSMSIYPKKMPALAQREDGTYEIDLQLHVGTDLRYKFTLGDGFWNAERTNQSNPITRQLIIPNQDLTLDHDIETWRSSSAGPITFEVNIPSESWLQDEKFIQFKAEAWTEPIPLWPTGGGNYLYMLFSPLDNLSSLGYRFCRNSDCQQALSTEATHGEVQIKPGSPSQKISISIDRWENWERLVDDNYNASAVPLPPNPSDYSTIIELSPAMDASWEVYAPLGLSSLAGSEVSTVIFSPRWHIKSGDVQLQPVLGSTPFNFQLANLLRSARSLDLQLGLFPQIKYEGPQLDWLNNSDLSEAQLEIWQASYRRFMLNYAKSANNSQSDWLILGGNAVIPALFDGTASDGLLLDLPEERDEYWQKLIGDIRAMYWGKVLWAAHVHRAIDPLPEFVDELDGIYLLVDSPLSTGKAPTSDEIAQAFSSLIDNHIYEVYRTTGKPVYMALAYPSLDGGSQGCQLVNQGCLTDGLFLPDDVEGLPVDLQEQSLIYSAILPVVASRQWIAGASIRGYAPTVNIQDGSSSIAGKPAENIIQDWFIRINTP